MRAAGRGRLLPLLLLAAQLACSAAAAYVAHQTVYLPARFGRPVYSVSAPHGYLAVVGPLSWSASHSVHHGPPAQSTAHAAPHSAAKAPSNPRTPAPADAPSLPPPRTNDTYGAYVLAGGSGYSYGSEAGSNGGSGGGVSGTTAGGTGSGLPKLKLDYGVPVTGFLEAQSSSVSSGTSINWSVEMTPANQSLPLIPDDIPVMGDDLPDDGCARNEVRLRPTHRSYSSVQPCQPILEQGCCPEGQWVVVNRYTRMGECAPRLCPTGFAFVERDGLCHDLQEEGLCPDDRRVYVTAFGEPRCSCADGQYVDTDGQCRSLYSTASCPYHQQLNFNYAFRLECKPAVCPPERPVPFQGWCKNFGDPCGSDYRFVLGFDTTRLEPKCYLSEELEGGGSGVSSRRQPSTTAAPAPSTSPAPAATLPAFQETYLPPPGRGRTQYARRRGQVRGRWMWQRRRRQQQQRNGGRRRRVRLQPRPQQQQPPLSPWSRLDIDQVTFVDSERVSSEQLAQFERSERPGRRRRFRRQIFAEVPLLNTCKPGARSGPNFKCRDKALPGSGSRAARSPVPPAGARNCPSGQRLDALGRCRQTGGLLGK